MATKTSYQLGPMKIWPGHSTQDGQETKGRTGDGPAFFMRGSLAVVMFRLTDPARGTVGLSIATEWRDVASGWHSPAIIVPCPSIAGEASPKWRVTMQKRLIIDGGPVSGAG